MPVSTSPHGLPVTIDMRLKFAETISYLVEGKKVHKLEWKDKGYYGVMDGGILKLHKPDGNMYDWLLSDGDLLGEDYILL